MAIEWLDRLECRCGFKSFSEEEWNRHRDACGRAQLFCLKCNYMFFDLATFNKHRKYCDKPPEPPPPRVFIDLDKQTDLSEIDPQRFCLKCYCLFSDLYGFNQHLKYCEPPLDPNRWR